MPSSRKRIVLWIATGLVAGGAVLFSLYYFGAFQQRVLACRITLPTDEEESITLTDPSQLEELVLKPIRLARPDLTPADYKVFGDLIIEYDDGTQESYWLFIPFGHYKRGNGYYVADFGALRSEIKRRIKDRKGMEHTLRSLDYQP